MLILTERNDFFLLPADVRNVKHIPSDALCVRSIGFLTTEQMGNKEHKYNKRWNKATNKPNIFLLFMCFLYRHMGVCSCSLLPINIIGNNHATHFDVVDVFCVCQFRNFISEMWNSAKMSWMLLWSRSWGAVALYFSYIHYMLYRRDEQYYLKRNVALCI